MPTAQISVVQHVIGSTPCTVVVDAIGSDLDGYDIEKCSFVWDFGDPSPSNNGGGRDEVWHGQNYIAKTSFPDPRFSSSLNPSSRQLEREVTPNSMQNGMVAAYTYYEAGTFTISLTVITPQGSDTATTQVEVVDGGREGAWLEIIVDPAGGGDVLTLEQAAALANKEGSKVVISLAPTTHTVSSTVTFTAASVRMLPTSYAASSRPTIKSGFDADAALVKFTGNDVYLENIIFKQDSKAVSAVNVSGLEINCSNVAIHRCYFQDLKRGILVSGGSGLYINQCTINATRTNGIELSSGASQVVSGNWIYHSSGSLTSLSGDLIRVVSTSICALQWNYLKYNATLAVYATTDTYPQNNGSNTNRGPIGIETVAHCHIYGNYGTDGTNTFSKVGNSVVNTRVEANIFGSGGENAIIDLCDDVLNTAFVSNVLLVGNGGPHSVAFYGYSGGGENAEINIVHNTIVLTDNIKQTQGVLNFAANGRKLNPNAFFVKNNLFVDHRQFIGKFIVCDSASHFSGLGSNVFPVRRNAVPVAKFGGTEYDWDSFIESGFSGDDSRVTVQLDDMNRCFRYIADKSVYQDLQNGEVLSHIVVTDLLGNLRSDGEEKWTVGAVESPAEPFPDDTGEEWTCTFTPVARTNRSDGALPSNVDGYNGYITVTDTKNGFVLMGDAGSGASLPLLTENDATVGNRVGANVKTEMRFEAVANGFNLTITYTNDNGGGQTSASRNIGAVRFLSWDLGRLFRVVDGRFGVHWREFDNFTGNIFNLAIWDYPYDIFSPHIIMQNRDYAIGISIMTDYVENDRRWRQQVHSYTSPAESAVDTTIQWINDGSGGTQDKLVENESFSVTFSVRITRAPKQWLPTLAPYKEWFASTFGEVEYAHDPRPITGIVPAQGGDVNNRFCYNNYITTDSQGRTLKYLRPDHYGWGGWADIIRKVHQYNGFDRFLMWCVAGNYLTNAGLNYPSRMFTPLLLTSEPHYDALINPSNLTTDTRGYPILYPSEVPAGTTRPLIDTLDELVQLGFDIPSMGYYFGRVGHVDDLPWDSGVSAQADYDDPENIQAINDELDIGAAYFKGTHFGLDAYSFGNLADDIAFLEDMRVRHPNIGYPMVELQPCDIVSRTAPGFTNNANGGIWTYSPHAIGHYILPGMDLLCAIRYDFYDRKIGGRIVTDDQKLCIMENMAAMGYTVLVYDDIYLDDPETYYAANVRFDFNDAPINHPTMAAPSNVRRVLYDEVVNKGFNLNNTYAVIRWDANTEPDFDHYIVYKAKIVDGESVPEQGYVVRQYTKRTTYYDSAVEVGKTYYYKIKAVDVFGNESSFSDVVTVNFVADDPSLPAPANLRRDTASGLGSLTLTWS